MSDEIFLLVNDTFEGIATTVSTYATIEELNYQLKIDTYGDLEEDAAVVYQGTMVPATFIPYNFQGVTPYIYIPNPLGITDVSVSTEAHFEKVKGDSEEIAMTIEELIREKTFQFDNGNAEVCINDVRIFLGVELSKVLQVPEEHIDEEMIDRIGKLVSSMNDYNKKLEDGEYDTKN